MVDTALLVAEIPHTICTYHRVGVRGMGSLTIWCEIRVTNTSMRKDIAILRDPYPMYMDTPIGVGRGLTRYGIRMTMSVMDPSMVSDLFIPCPRVPTTIR